MRAVNADLTDAFHDGHLRLLPRRAEDLPVPTGTVESPVTRTSWEGIGVKPDVAVPADQALDAALAEARKPGAH